MKKVVLKNGLRVILEKRPTNSVAIEVSVDVGSNDEPLETKGISHFVEHMLFEGTKNRTTHEIANAIESVGGEINAITSSERTSYYIVILGKYINRALDILADIIQNPLFDEKSIEKERKVILDEVNLTIDDPKIHQWILFQRTLYKKHPCRFPVYGTKETVLKINRQDLFNFYKKYYVPKNIVMSVVGNFKKDIIKKIEKKFSFTGREAPQRKKVVEPNQKRNRKFVEKRDILQSYFVLGYKAVPRMHPDSFVFDVIKAILGRGQSSRLFDEVRTKRGLAYSIGFHYEDGTDFGWVAVYAGTDKKNINKIKHIVLKEMEALRRISDQELKDAINFIEGDYLLSHEDNQSLASTLNTAEILGDLSLADKYISKIKKVTKKDIRRVVTRYLKKYTCIIIQQKD